MKLKIPLFILALLKCMFSFGQVGLLSSNNNTTERKTFATDTSYFLPSIRFSDYYNWYSDDRGERPVIYGSAYSSVPAAYIDRLNRQKRLTDSVFALLIINNNQRTRELFYEKFSRYKSENNDLAKTIIQSNFLTRHYPVDSLQAIQEFEKFTRDMSLIYADFVALEKSNDKRLSQIESAVVKMENSTNIDNIKFDSTDLIKLQKNLVKSWTEIAKDTQFISNSFKVDTAIYYATKTNYEAKLKSYISKKVKVEKEKSESDFGAFPQLLSILGKNQIIPQLQAYGSYKHENATKSFEGIIGLSFAPSNNPDTANLYSIFIPNASKFLVHSAFSWSFIQAGKSSKDTTSKLLGLLLDIDFATKNLIFDSVKNSSIISSSMVYTKAGLEFAILP